MNKHFRTRGEREPAEETERWSGGQKESESVSEWPKDTQQAHDKGGLDSTSPGRGVVRSGLFPVHVTKYRVKDQGVIWDWDGGKSGR